MHFCILQCTERCYFSSYSYCCICIFYTLVALQHCVSQMFHMRIPFVLLSYTLNAMHESILAWCICAVWSLTKTLTYNVCSYFYPTCIGTLLLSLGICLTWVM